MAAPIGFDFDRQNYSIAMERAEELGTELAVRPQRLPVRASARGRDIVTVLERVYVRLFQLVLWLTLMLAVLGLALACIKGDNSHLLRSALIGAAAIALSLWAIARSEKLYRTLLSQERLLLGVVSIPIVLIALDGTWRSTYYLTSNAILGIPAVCGGARWTRRCVLLMTVEYVAALLVWGYTPARLAALNDIEWVGGNFIAFYAIAITLAVPSEVLGRHLLRFNQLVALTPRTEPRAAPAGSPPGGPADETVTDALVVQDAEADARDRVARLSARQLEVAILVAEGLTSPEIAKQLFISPRTVDRHVEDARKKIGADNRAQLATVLTLAGLVFAYDADAAAGVA
jgi:DNA-binding CsgD family transcriptional regulator